MNSEKQKINSPHAPFVSLTPSIQTSTRTLHNVGVLYADQTYGWWCMVEKDLRCYQHTHLTLPVLHHYYDTTTLTKTPTDTPHTN